MRGTVILDEIADAINSGALLIAPTHRMVTAIRSTFELEIRSQFNSVISRRPRVLEFREWVARLYSGGLADQQEFETASVLGSESWLKTICAEVMERHFEGVNEALVEDVYRGIRIFQLWQIDDATYLNQGGDEFFLKVRSEIREAWVKAGLFSVEDLCEILLEGRQPLPVGVERQALLLDFFDLPPLYNAVIQKFIARVGRASLGKLSGEKYIAQFNCLEDEIVEAANWTRQTLQDNPSATIGVVIPELGAIRKTVDEVFADAFGGQGIVPGGKISNKPYRILPDKSIGDEAVVVDALRFLRLANSYSIELTEFADLMFSPFWSEGQFGNVLLNNLCQHLRKFGNDHIRISRIRASMVAVDEGAFEFHPLCNVFEQAVQRKIKERSNRNPLAYWAGIFKAQLECLGWPVSERLNESESAAVERFMEEINYLSLLEDSRALTCFDALRFIGRLCKRIRVPSDKKGCRIHVLGVSDAVGLRFSHAWVVGMSEADWPPRSAPNPFIPLPIQRSLRVSRCDNSQQAEWAREITEALLVLAKTSVYSYSDHTDTGDKSSLSGLFFTRQMTIYQSKRTASDIEVYQSMQCALVQVETVDDSFSPPVNNTEKLTGGASLLSMQAGCPFNAFARFRLGATVPEKGNSWLTRSDRGTLLHKVLAGFWGRYKSSLEVRNFTQDKINSEMTDIATRELSRLLEFRGFCPGPGMRRVEVECLVGLALAFLKVDLDRNDFSVAGIEVPVQWKVNGRTLDFRIDRIDQLSCGGRMVIDYKTGKSISLRQWSGDRPEAPQVPLYSIVTPGVVAASFGRINRDGCRYTGLCADGSEVPPGVASVGNDGNRNGLPNSWDAVLSAWQLVASSLVEEFCRGDSSVVFHNRGALDYADDFLPLNRYQSVRG